MRGALTARVLNFFPQVPDDPTRIHCPELSAQMARMLARREERAESGRKGGKSSGQKRKESKAQLEAELEARPKLPEKNRSEKSRTELGKGGRIAPSVEDQFVRDYQRAENSEVDQLSSSSSGARADGDRRARGERIQGGNGGRSLSAPPRRPNSVPAPQPSVDGARSEQAVKKGWIAQLAGGFNEECVRTVAKGALARGLDFAASVLNECIARDLTGIEAFEHLDARIKRDFPDHPAKRRVAA